MRREVIVGSTVAFIASFCTLVIELVAGRILAPYVGVSLYTWTSIIGVVLSGISLGAYLGGLLADRYPRGSTLGWLLFVSGLSALSIPILADSLGIGTFLQNSMNEFRTSLMMRILITTTFIFFVPALILGMISPVVVKLAVNDLEKSGNTVGKIYAFSTLGSILGTFATGFFLIEQWGTRTLLYGVGAVLICCAPIFGGLLAGNRALRTAVITGSLIYLGFALTGLWLARDAVARPLRLYFPGRTWMPAFYYDNNGDYLKETEYYTIRVAEGDYHGNLGRTLVLDHLIHSFTNVEDPLYLKYEYLRIYEELVAWHRSTRTNADEFLFVGGGGYTLPRYFDHAYPDAKIDVVEIDRWVSKVAHERLGIRETRIRTYNMDGRWFAMNKNAITGSDEKYDFIFGDAFNDLSIPYHLTTTEFDQHLKRLLKPDGLLMALVIDNVGKGQFMPTYIRTLQEVFGRDNVYLVVFMPGDLDDLGSHTCIIVASQTSLDMNSFSEFLTKRIAVQRQAAGATELLAKGSTPFGMLAAPGLGAIYNFADQDADRKTAAASAAAVLAEGTAPFGLLAAGGCLEANDHLHVSYHFHRKMSRVVPPDRLARWMATRKRMTGREPMVLTDDHVPVDNLVAPMFEERFGFRK